MASITPEIVAKVVRDIPATMVTTVNQLTLMLTHYDRPLAFYHEVPVRPFPRWWDVSFHGSVLGARDVEDILRFRLPPNWHHVIRDAFGARTAEEVHEDRERALYISRLRMGHPEDLPQWKREMYEKGMVQRDVHDLDQIRWLREDGISLTFSSPPGPVPAQGFIPFEHLRLIVETSLRSV